MTQSVATGSYGKRHVPFRYLFLVPASRLGRMLARLCFLTIGAFLWSPCPVAEAGSGDGDRILQDIAGQALIHRVASGDTLAEIAVARRVGYIALLAANPAVDAWVPTVGTDLILPTRYLLPDAPRRGIVINLAEMRLFAFTRSERVIQMPVGLGRKDAPTPSGETRIVAKRTDPVWHPPASVRAARPYLPAEVPPGPDNPLGPVALTLDWPEYLIHGTNSPFTIGRRATNGCIRLFNTDARRLFEIVPVGTPVRIIDQPVKVGWSGGRLYLEVHPTVAQIDAIEARQPPPPDWKTIADAVALIRSAVSRKGNNVQVNWALVRKTASEHRGIPVAVSGKDRAEAGIVSGSSLHIR